MTMDDLQWTIRGISQRRKGEYAWTPCVVLSHEKLIDLKTFLRPRSYSLIELVELVRGWYGGGNTKYC